MCQTHKRRKATLHQGSSYSESTRESPPVSESGKNSVSTRRRPELSHVRNRRKHTTPQETMSSDRREKTVVLAAHFAAQTTPQKTTTFTIQKLRKPRRKHAQKTHLFAYQKCRRNFWKATPNIVEDQTEFPEETGGRFWAHFSRWRTPRNTGWKKAIRQNRRRTIFFLEPTGER